MNADPSSADEARYELYRIMRQDADFETKARRALELGEAYLGVENGHIARVDPGSEYWEAVVSTGGEESPYSVGTVLDLQRTFCQHTIQREGSLAVHDAIADGFGDDPAFQSQRLRTYHGSTIEVDGGLFGTVCFVDDDPREPFEEHETLFAELVARMLEHELTCVTYESELARRADLLDVVNRVLRHNLRNDMNVVLGSAETLAAEFDDDVEELDRILDTVNRLLDLSATARRLDAIVRRDLRYEEHRLGDLVEESVAPVRAAYPAADIEVGGNTDARAPVKASLRSAIEELVENAAKHAGPEPEIRVSIADANGRVRLRVEDTGPGLPSQERAVLVDGKETPLVHGSGLGLWMVYWIVTDHGGSVDAAVTDRGTSVTLTVPKTPFDAPW